MTDQPGVPPSPGPGRSARGRGRTPLDRLRTLDPLAPGSDQPGAVAAAPPPTVDPEPAPPAPAVIAVGDRPPAYDPPGTPPGGTVPIAASSAGPPRKQGSFLRELPILLVIAVVLALLIKTFLVQAFFIPSGSMEQTLHVHDRVLVNKLTEHTGNPQRGDIVVFNTAGTGFAGAGADDVPCPHANPVVSGIRAAQRFIGVGTCGQDDYIKRVIAVPGDKIHCCDPQGRVVLNGQPLDESYVYLNNSLPFCASQPGALRPAQTGAAACGSGATPVVVPAGMYWVMGDHRDDSDDSRYQGFVPRDKIVGRAFVRIWPLDRLGFLRVPATFSHVGSTALGVAATPVLAAPALALPLVGGRLLRRRRRRCSSGRRAPAA